MNNIPYNQEAEQSVLGAVFLEPSIIKMINDILNEKDFFEERHQVIYTAMKHLYSRSTQIDYMTIASELTSTNQMKAAGGIDYISSLSESVPSTANVEAYVRIVKDLSLKREVIDVAKSIVDLGYKGGMDSTGYIDFAEEKIFEVSKRRRTSEFLTISSVVEEVKKKTEQNMLNKGVKTGLITDFYRLDEITQGLQKEELLILAARPSMGKSAFALNIAVNAAKANKSGNAVIAIFSLEMSADQIISRMISTVANIEGEKIKSSNLDARDWRFFELGTKTLSNLNIYCDDSSSVSVADIRAKCRKLSQEKGLDLVVIDYLQLIRGDNDRANRQEEVSKISRSLKQMARELKVPVVALAQLSREVEKREVKRPMMADLRESGSIEQDADIVMFLYRDDYYNKEKSSVPGEAELIIAKNRQGSLDTIKLLWEPKFSRFKNKADENLTE